LTSPTLELRVKEARVRDVGRGIVRIDPALFEEIGVELGDIVLIKGVKGAVAKLMPSYPEERGQSCVHMDGLLRSSSGVSLEEKVGISKADINFANKVILSPIGLISAGNYKNFGKFIGSFFTGMPVMKENILRANLLGTRKQDFTVVETQPVGPVLITPSTHIVIREVKDNKVGRESTSYEDIGGLGQELERVREMIEIPLKYPQLFVRLGIAPPKGVLLYGPPGCGKTLMARAVASETSAAFISITGPEVMGKYYGESEGRLRSVFEEAKANSPSIIFIDEIDAIAPKREDVGGDKQVERRVVAQLLSLMDGLKSRGEIVVIGATNIPNSIDPALRRPGRFDREIEISIPNQKGRFEILQIHTRGMPLSSDVDLKKLSEITHGYVGADLEALAREAAMTVLRRLITTANFELSELSYEVLEGIEIKMADFMNAFQEIEPSAIREVFVEVPQVKWSDIGGLISIKKRLEEVVEWPQKFPDYFKKAGVSIPKGILLFGPPGTGKTLIAKALANESNVNFISVKGPELMSKYLGESEKSVREIFRKARLSSPCIVFFDEFDSIVPKRAASNDSRSVERVISQFLTELDGLEELKGVLILAATNRMELIDSAILRPGRFDLLIEVPLPDKDDRIGIFEVHAKNRPMEPNISIQDLATSAEGLSGADIKEICDEASMNAIREVIDSGDTELLIRNHHFDNALKWLKEQKERIQ